MGGCVPALHHLQATGDLHGHSKERPAQQRQKEAAGRLFGDKISPDTQPQIILPILSLERTIRRHHQTTLAGKNSLASRPISTCM